MRDFLFQFVMFFISIILGVIVPLLSKRRQMLVAVLFAVLLLITFLFWARYEVKVLLAKKGTPLILSKRWQKLVTVIFASLLVISLFWALYGVKTLLAKKDTPPAEHLKQTATDATHNLVLFEEDFEDKKAQGFRESGPLWQVIADETGNMVYDINNPEGIYWQQTSFGSEEWKDYKVEYNIRVVEFGRYIWNIGLWFRHTINARGNTYYVQAFQTQEVILEYAIDDSEWINRAVQFFNLKPEVWYSVRVVAQGTHLQVYIDDYLRLDVTDSLIKNGGLSILVSPETRHVQFDNIRVIEIGQSKIY